MSEHRPETWYRNADGDCPHGPEPDDDTKPEWDDWAARHVAAADGDGWLCLDAPMGDFCAGCSGDHIISAVRWVDCPERAVQP